MVILLIKTEKFTKMLHKYYRSQHTNISDMKVHLHFLYCWNSGYFINTKVLVLL